MARPKTILSIPKQLDGLSTEIIEVGTTPHAANIIISNYDALRARELAEVRGIKIGDIVRNALDSMLNQDPEAEAIGVLAVRRLEFTVELDKQRQTLLNQIPDDPSRI